MTECATVTQAERSMFLRRRPRRHPSSGVPAYPNFCDPLRTPKLVNLERQNFVLKHKWDWSMFLGEQSRPYPKGAGSQRTEKNVRPPAFAQTVRSKANKSDMVAQVAEERVS